MEKTQDKVDIRSKTAILTVGADAIMILAAVICTGLRGIESLASYAVMSCGMDVVGMLVGFVILLCTYVDMQRVGVDYKYFRYLLEVIFVGLFTDLMAWLLGGLPELAFLSLLVNTVFYLAIPSTAFYFWKYVTQILGTRDETIDRIEFWIRFGFIIELILIFANIFGGFLFTVDEMGVYQRGPVYPLFMLYLFVLEAVIAVLLILWRKRFTRHQIAAIAVYLATPLPVMIFSLFIYGLSMNFTMCMVDILVVYGILSIEQGREKIAAEKELNMASSIQEGVLPHLFPLFPERTEFDIHASMDPAREVGGDFYDAFLIDEDHLGLVIADVSGKGVPAALFMLIAKTLIKNRALMGGTPAEILMDVNPQLHEGNKAKMFVTVWLGIVTISTGHVAEVNAGHEHPAIRRADGTFELLERKHGFVLGGMKKVKYQDDEFDLAPGDTLFVYTDGVPEATDAKGKRFGTERMLSALNADPGLAPKDLLSKIRSEVDAFVGTAPQFDDLTMLSLKYYGK